MIRVFILYFVMVVLSSNLQGAIPESERAALIDFYNAMSGDNWRLYSPWKDADGAFRPHGTEREWDGVLLDENNSHVIGLQIFSPGLSGELPESLKDLPNLSSIGLGFGNLGDSFPPILEELTNLKLIQLSYLGISGALPKLGNLTKLRTLELEANEFSGSIPEEWKNLEDLSFINLSSNQLSGPLPVWLKDMKSMRLLNLSCNRFDGKIPEGIVESGLESLMLSNNLFSGELPESLGFMSELRNLDLSSNFFIGPVPQSLLERESFFFLNLSCNSLSYVPTAISNSRLTLHLSYNVFDHRSKAGIQQLWNHSDLTFVNQLYGVEVFDVEPLAAVIPWVVSNEQWGSTVLVTNNSSEDRKMLYTYSNGIPGASQNMSRNGITKADIFGSQSGYMISVYGEPEDVRTGYITFNRRTASGRSPAQTTGIPRKSFSERLVFPYLPGSKNTSAALVLVAPESEGDVPVKLKLHGKKGLIGEREWILKSGQPRAGLLSTIFEGETLTDHLMVVAESVDGTLLAGTVYGFNSINEPSMSGAFPLHGQVSNRFVLPWMVSSLQWGSRMAVANPNSEPVVVNLTATDREGLTRSIDYTIPAGSLFSELSEDIFGDMNGYSVVLESFSKEGKVLPVAGSQLVYKRGPNVTDPSPAQMGALDLEVATSSLTLTNLSLEDIPAVVLVAPENNGQIEVELTLHRLKNGYAYGYGFASDILKGAITLSESKPHAYLLSDLFPDLGTDGLIASLSVEADSGGIVGATFSFNEQREPSMSGSSSRAMMDLLVEGVTAEEQCGEGVVFDVTILNDGRDKTPPGVMVHMEIEGRSGLLAEIPRSLEPGERIVIEFTVDAYSEEMIEVVVDPDEVLIERDENNNRLTLSLGKEVLFSNHDSISSTNSGLFIGLIFADQDGIVAPTTGLFLACEEDLVLSVEKMDFRIERDAERNPQPVIDWAPTSDLMAVWQREGKSILIEGGEPGSVYRVIGEILGGEATERMPILHVSRSAYTKATFDGIEDGRVKRVYHPFYMKNFDFDRRQSPDTDISASFTGDDDEDPFFTLVQFSLFSMRELLSNPADIVIELPEGVLHSEARHSLHLNDNYDNSIYIYGQGVDATLIAGPKRFFDGWNDGAIGNALIQFADIEKVSARDFSLWGSHPNLDLVQEVSGRTIPLEGWRGRNGFAHIYEWFPAGLAVRGHQRAEFHDLRIEYCSTGLNIQGNDPLENGDWATELWNLDLKFGFEGLRIGGFTAANGLRWRGEGSQVYHMSTQGVACTNCNDVHIENLLVDGGRHRGFNFDRASRIELVGNEVLNSGQTAIHFGGGVHDAVVEGNLIDTVDRDMQNAFGDTNAVDGIMPYRPLYEGVKVVRGLVGDSSNILITGNQIRNTGDGIFIGQGNVEGVVIEDNEIATRRRGIRLEYGHAHTMSPDGEAFFGSLNDAFVLPDNDITLISDSEQPNPSRYRLLFPCGDAYPDGRNVGFLDSYGLDHYTHLSFYPLPLSFFASPDCETWLTNDDVTNAGEVFIPQPDEDDYVHPRARFGDIEAVDPARIEALRAEIREKAGNR